VTTDGESWTQQRSSGVCYKKKLESHAVCDCFVFEIPNTFKPFGSREQPDRIAW